MKIITSQKKPFILLITEIITSNMKGKGIKTKIDHPKNILISDIINNHKTHGKLKAHSGN